MEHNNCDCEICKRHYKFNLPEEIIDAAKTGNLVIFAGAGVSTEAKGVFPKTIYQMVKDEMSCNEDLSFSDLMEKYCKQRNGRIKLLNKIKDRMDYVNSFSEMINWACRFHFELSTIYSIKDIITTNWDDYFERYCGCVPFVTSKDFALSSIKDRKVYKIHGSIQNYGSIIASKSDYDRCYNELQKNLIGSKMKLLMSDPEKVVVFIGYSLYDEDFIKINNYLKNEMGDLLPHSYIVTLDENINNRLDENMTPIITDATYFLSSIKEDLVSQGFMINDKIYSLARYFYELYNSIHEQIQTDELSTNPMLIYSLVFQDGVIHSLERVSAMKKTGYYSDPNKITNSIKSYKLLLEEYSKKNIYIEMAYIEGYLYGLELLDDYFKNKLPDKLRLYFDFTPNVIDSIEDIAEHSFNETTNAAFEYASKKVHESNDVIFHHKPLL